MHKFSLIKLFSSFANIGAEWVMWVLLAISVVSISIMVERSRYYRSLRDSLEDLADELNRLLRAGEAGAAAERLRRSPSPAALVALAGLGDIERGPHAVEKVMEAKISRVRPRLEKNLTILNTIGNNAPFVGLFGTVIGIIQSFDALRPPAGAQGAAAAAAATAATGRVMGTIAEALVATAIGLLVAIPAVAAFNYFTRTVKSILASTDALSQLVVAHAHATHGRDDELKTLIELLRGEPHAPRAATESANESVELAAERVVEPRHSEGIRLGVLTNGAVS